MDELKRCDWFPYCDCGMAIGTTREKDHEFCREPDEQRDDDQSNGDRNG